MNFKEILELIDKVAASGIAAVEVERAGVKVKIEGRRSEMLLPPSGAGEVKWGQQVVSQPTPQTGSPTSPTVPDSGAADEPDPSLHVIKSPIVGTYYRSPNPEAEVFVNVGDSVAKGKVLCIIEAMKLMNEIECDVDGVVTMIFPQNGQPVEYGEKLFAIKPF